MSGFATPTNFSKSLNIGLCRQMDDLQIETDNVRKRMALLDKEYDVIAQDYVIKLNEANELSLAAAKILASSTTLMYINQLQNEKTNNDNKISFDYNTIDSACSDDKKINECNFLLQEINDLLKQNQQLAKEINTATMHALNDKRKYDIAKAQADTAKEIADDVFKVYESKKTELKSQESSLNDSYKRYGEIEGGFANVNYNTGWQQNLQKLQNDNLGKIFVYEPTFDATYYVGFPKGESSDTYLSSIPAVLSYSVNGIGYVPWGNGNTEQKMPSMSDTLAATLRISLAGACPIDRPENFDVKKNNSGVPLFNISAGYNYVTAYRRNITATYNLYKVYSLIKSSGNQGGWFHSSSWNSIVENNWQKEVFSIDWESEDPNASLEEKRKTEMEIKNELISRAMALMATPAGAPNLSVVDFPIPVHGGIVIADGINGICGSFSMYCAAVTWTFRGVDAIWGSSFNESRFQKTYDVTVSEKFSDAIATKTPAFTVFGASI